LELNSFKKMKRFSGYIPLLILTFVLAFHNNLCSQESMQLIGFDDPDVFCEVTYSLQKQSDAVYLLTADLKWLDKKSRTIEEEKKCLDFNIVAIPSNAAKTKSGLSSSVLGVKAKNTRSFTISNLDQSRDIQIAIQPFLCELKENQTKNIHPPFSVPVNMTMTIPALAKSGFIASDRLPDLVILNERFLDADSNNIINAGEKTFIQFDIQNIGKGDALDVEVLANANKEVKGLYYNKKHSAGSIPPGVSRTITIPVNASKDLESSILEFRIDVNEGNGFDAFPLAMKIETLEYQPPDPVIAEYKFSTDDGEKIKMNYPIHLEVVIKNNGKGKATGHKVRFSFQNPECRSLDISEGEFIPLDILQPGGGQIVDFLFTITRKYDHPGIPINVSIFNHENAQVYDTVLSVALDQRMIARRLVEISPVYATGEVIRDISLSSHVDRNIPVSGIAYPNKFALVIGNEDYSKYQHDLNTEANVGFAKNDARIFMEYANKVFGIPRENIFLLLDATAGEMNQKVNVIAKMAEKAITTEGYSEIIFYYAGHGLPDEVTREPYIIPVDVTGTDLSSALRLPDLISKLSASGAQKVILFVDACFSGGSRSEGLIAARGVKVVPKQDILPSNVLMFSATNEAQSALSLNDQHHGIFTYYLLKELQETQGNVTYGELFDQVSKNVSMNSLRMNQKEQDPVVKAGFNIVDVWRGWRVGQ